MADCRYFPASLQLPYQMQTACLASTKLQLLHESGTTGSETQDILTIKHHVTKVNSDANSRVRLTGISEFTLTYSLFTILL